MRLNTAVSHPPERTHEGAVAARITPILELRRTVCACLLWEDSFYESGQSIAQRITELVATTDPDEVAALAIEARERMKLRHVPLLLARELVRRKVNVASLLERIIQRPDELTEFLAVYWKDGRQPLASSVKRGLARAMAKFNAYSLAKYNRKDAIKLRDVLFLTHGKPKDAEGDATTAPPIAKPKYQRGAVHRHAGSVYSRLVEGTLETPDTWEVALSGGADKRETFTRLIAENKLGALALLRNLRNMQEAKVDDAVIRSALRSCQPDRVLPFRFISAAKYAPRFEPELEALMFKCLAERPKMAGRTVLVVDGSGSMFGAPVSAKSEIDRFEAAAALAMLVREACERAEVIVFSTTAKLVPARRGFALRDALYQGAEQGGTNTETAKLAADALGYDRVIILTDEQSHQTISAPQGKGYVINVASYKNGIGYGPWTHIDGWSEACLDFIQAVEAE